MPGFIRLNGGIHYIAWHLNYIMMAINGPLFTKKIKKKLKTGKT
jgi:hypothetical protein